MAQNDATVKGSGSHDKTGRHCLPNDPNGKLDIPKHAGYWLRDEDGKLTKAFRHICWDGCMFPNDVLTNPEDLERDPGGHDLRAATLTDGAGGEPMSKPLRIGMIGYGFMGRTHSNAYRKVTHFFDLDVPAGPARRSAAATRTRSKAFAENWGYESVETDWRKLVERDDIDAVDICTPNNLHTRDRHRRRRGTAR